VGLHMWHCSAFSRASYVRSRGCALNSWLGAVTLFTPMCLSHQRV